jgi:hypothetical protein
LSEIVNPQNITGMPRTIRDLFTSRKYGLQFYQREYAWTESNISELIDDLVAAFLSQYSELHDRTDVASYRPYFLGPIVTNSSDKGTSNLVDGQQRLTTLTLLLIHLQHLQQGRTEVMDLGPLVYSTKYGKPTFNLETEGRNECMEAILNSKPFSLESLQGEEKESVENIWYRYQDVCELFPEELQDEALPYFIDWFLERVVVVEISAVDEEMGLEIFETMNDRGLRLSATDMLKGYLLANIRISEDIASANKLWRERIRELSDAERNADSDFIKNWLRSKHAETIREPKKDAVPGDWDMIGTAFNKWVRDRAAKSLDLRQPQDYKNFVNHDFKKLSGRYLELIEFSKRLTPGAEHVYYNASNGFTLQYQTILAAVIPDDDTDVFMTKVQMVAGYLDLYVTRRMVNQKNFGYSTVKYTMFNLAKEIRDLSCEDLALALKAHIKGMTETFEAVDTFGLNMRNGPSVKYFLARLSDWLDVGCGKGETFIDFMDRERKNPFEIEHVWANKYEQHSGDFDSEHAFGLRRNQVGDLLLLPKDFNASYGAMPFNEKVVHYAKHNVLASSLASITYINNPSFLRFAEEHHLELKSYQEFASASITERQLLYRRMAEIIWNPANFGI